MKPIQTVNAKGIVLCHDIAQIIKGVTESAIFRRDHVVTRENMPVLLSVGEDQFYIWEKKDGMLHKNSVVETLCDMRKGQNMERSQAEEGKIGLTAIYDDLLGVGNRGFKAVNGSGQMIIATRYGNFTVKKGDKLAGTRVILLVTEEEKMEAVKRAAAEATGGYPILELRPFLYKKVGIVITGNEVSYGRIQDTLIPVIRGKLPGFDAEVIDHVTWNDNDTKMTVSILDTTQKGADMVVCMDGMSAGPGGKTPLAIWSAGANTVSCEVSVLPGAIFLLAYYQVRDGENPHTVAIMGFPGYVMYVKRAVFDLVLPGTTVDDQVTADDLAALGQGGFCLNYLECIFPNCESDREM